MFGNLRERIISVGKTVKLFAEVKQPVLSVQENVNLNAGARLLTNFQIQWEQIHELNEENAQKGENLALIISQLHTKITTDHRNMSDIAQLLSIGTTSLSKSVENSVNQLENLANSFENVEKSLLQLENLIENLEQQEKELEHRFQLTLYKEKKLANLETLRMGLAEKHTQSVTEFELRQKQMLQERQKTFQEAFQSDLQIYKEAGTLPKIQKVEDTKSAILEEIQLDCDSKDLDNFLSD